VSSVAEDELPLSMRPATIRASIGGPYANDEPRPQRARPSAWNSSDVQYSCATNVDAGKFPCADSPRTEMVGGLVLLCAWSMFYRGGRIATVADTRDHL
jgi:hypothetical protein